MCSVIRHRGPDGAGFARVGDGSTLLGHVRLSIIDLGTGAQPLFNEDHSVGIVFNGEIYDYQAHRATLIKAGHTFRTQSDTEVIVHLYEEHGLTFLEHLNGKFAMVIYDDRTQQLVAARDRLGVKPLFFAALGQELLLASEAKTLYAWQPKSGRETAPNRRARHRYRTLLSTGHGGHLRQLDDSRQPADVILIGDVGVRIQRKIELRRG